MAVLDTRPDTNQPAPARLFGSRVVRREDERFLHGGGQYIANLDLPGSAWVTYVVSTAAHARVRGVDVEAARRLPSVVDVVTAADLDIGPYPPADPAYPQ